MSRAVFFDVDGVLVDGYHARPDLQPRWDESLLGDLGIDPEQFRNEFIYDVFLKKVIVGQMALVDALERVLPSLGFKRSPMIVVHYWLSHDSTINKPLLDAIARLKASPDIRLFIATNQEHMRAHWLWQVVGLGDLFEDMFYSARAGVMKPEKAFFDFATARIGPQDEQPLFFDDTPRMIEGARSYGWEAVPFNTLEDVTCHPWLAARFAQT